MRAQFEAGMGTHFEGGVNFILAENKYNRFYAEIAVPEGASEDYGYMTMYRELTKLIEHFGAYEDIDWQYSGQEQYLSPDASADAPVYIVMEYDGDVLFDGIRTGEEA